MKRVLGALLLLLVAGGSIAADRLGYVERLRTRIWGKSPRLSAGDFPAGVSAPVDDVASIPSRPTTIGYVPRASSAALLLAADSLFKPAYGIEVKPVAFESEDLLRKALTLGGDNGGVDLSVLSVAQLALSAQQLRDAAPRAVLLMSRSRGQDVLAAMPGIESPAGLRGKRLGFEPRSTSRYFALWALSRAGLSLRELTLVPIESTGKASDALKEKRVDAVVGLQGELEPALGELNAKVVTSTVDAPHLIAWVLVARGDFAAHYPDAIRRILRGQLDANAQVSRDASSAARLLGDAAPFLGDPTAAISTAPPSSLRDNLAFFGLAGEAPVTFAEMFQSAGALGTRLDGSPPVPPSEDACDLGPLKYVSSARSP